MFPSQNKDIICKKGDKLLFVHDFNTGEDAILQVYETDEFNTVLKTVYHSYLDDVGYIFELDIDSSFDILTNYRVKIKDFFFTDPTELDKDYFIYVNNDLEMENDIIRSLGLSGHNCRYYDHVWQNGLLTQFKIRFYDTKIALELADAGGADDFIASYTVTIYFDSNYNPYEIRSIKD